MLGTITRGEQKYDPIPDNVYLAKLLHVKEKNPPKDHPEWFPQLSWAFEIVYGPLAKRRVWGKTPSNWVPGKKLDNWLQAIGLNAPNGTSLKIEDLKDAYVKVVVKTEHYQDRETKENKEFTSVKELLALDSLDQIKLRELAAGAPVVASTPAPATNVVASATTIVPQAPVVATPPVTPQPPVSTPVVTPVRTTPFGEPSKSNIPF